MNNNSFNAGLNAGINPNLQFVDFSKVKSTAKTSEEKAAARAKENAGKEESKNTDEIATQLGNRMLRDLGAFMINPIKGSLNFNQQLLGSVFASPYAALMNSKKNDKQEEPKVEEPAKVEEVETVEEAKAPEEVDTETIEYTYKPGDTFGQVVRDLGLESGNGLWGANGDVEYYTQQLIDQGIWPDGTRGNIPIGTTIKLKRRPYTQEMIEYRKQNGLD